MSAAAVAVMLGHAYPVFLGFQGGKAVASVVGAFVCLSPGALAAEIIIFVVIVAFTRHISMGSIVVGGHPAAGGMDGGARSGTRGDRGAAGRRVYYLQT